MYKEGRLNLKKAKALIAEEKAEKKIKKTNEFLEKKIPL